MNKSLCWLRDFSPLKSFPHVLAAAPANHLKKIRLIVVNADKVQVVRALCNAISPAAEKTERKD